MTRVFFPFYSSKMLLHDGPLRHILGELTNTVYEEPTIDDFGEHGQLLSKGDGEVCPYTLFLGIFVSLLPKVGVHTYRDCVHWVPRAAIGTAWIL